MPARIIGRHVGRAAIGGILLVLLVFIVLDSFLAFVGEFGDIGEGDYGVPEALWYVFLTIPRRIHFLFPTAALVGASLGVGMLAANSELVAMRGAGVSRLRISLAAVRGALVLLIPVLLLGEFVAPVGERHAQQLQLLLHQEELSIGPSSGIWVRDGDRVINIRRPVAVAGDELVELADIDIYSISPAGRLQSISHAQHARYVAGQWRVEELVTTALEPDGTSRVFRTASEVWERLMDPGLLEAAVMRPRDMAIRDLGRYISYLKDNRLDSRRYRSAYWSRVLWPATALAMVLAGMPFVFGSIRTGGVGQRLFFGMVLGIGFFIVHRASISVGEVYGIDPRLAASLPTALLLGLTVWVLRRGV